MIFKIICIACLAFLIIEDLLIYFQNNELTLNIGMLIMVICNFLPLLYIVMNQKGEKNEYGNLKHNKNKEN